MAIGNIKIPKRKNVPSPTIVNPISEQERRKKGFLDFSNRIGDDVKSGNPSRMAKGALYAGGFLPLLGLFPEFTSQLTKSGVGPGEEEPVDKPTNTTPETPVKPGLATLGSGRFAIKKRESKGKNIYRARR